MKKIRRQTARPDRKFRTVKEIMQYIVCSVILKFLYHGLRILYRHDDRVKQDLDRIDRGTTIRLSCSSHGPELKITASEHGIDRCTPRRCRRYLKNTADGSADAKAAESAEKLPDIDIRFKGLAFSFAVFTGQIGIAEAFSGHMMYVNGDFSKIMSLVRCMEQAERYLFPSFMGRRILKKLLPKKISSLRLYASIIFSMILR